MKLLRIAALLVVVGCVSGAAFAGSFQVGQITCYAGNGSWTGEADDVHGAGPGTLAYTWPASGLEILTTENCIANLGAVAYTKAQARSTVECLSVEGDIVIATVASTAGISDGVTSWRDEETEDAYISTLACRVRRLE